jgi:integrase
LRPEDVTEQSIRIGNAKTAAGIREVPMHPVLWPLVTRLMERPSEGFLLPGSAGSYDKRTNALGTRFGRLKTAMGFSDRHVFHSIRKTVVSQLEQAGVGENVTADIVGHEKPRITYGLYSSGTSLQQKAEAIAKVAYPGSLTNPTRIGALSAL